MYLIETNDERFVTTATVATIRKWMLAYAKKKRSEGMPLVKVKFVYGRINYVPLQSKKFEGLTTSRTSE